MVPRPFRNDLLHQILSQPSAPFRERHVISAILHELEDAKIPHFTDPVGNIVIGARSASDYLKLVRQQTREPIRVFIAHMDHPGFHGAKWKSPTELEVKWHGGSPTQGLAGSKVWLADRDGGLESGTVISAELIASGRAIDRMLVQVDPSLSQKHKQAPEIYGGFAFRAPHWQEGEVIYTKAADDLVGSFAILSLALDYWASGRKRGAPPFIGLLTRAEEVGFIGAIGHFELGWLRKARRPVVCVSLETSRTLPGAEIGKGPVVRLGDKYTVFDSGSVRVFSELAQAVLPDRHQRRVMDGGTCEATAATVYGYPCIGISVPLGNYHNQNFEGGPDAGVPLGPAPEFVHLGDVMGLLTLCHAIIQPKLPWTKPFDRKLKEFKRDLKDYRALLRSGP